MKYAILAADNRGDSHPYGEVNEKRNYSKRQEGKNQDLPVRSEYRSQHYAFINPFFQDLKSGFFFLATNWKLEKGTIS